MQSQYQVMFSQILIEFVSIGLQVHHLDFALYMVGLMIGFHQAPTHPHMALVHQVPLPAGSDLTYTYT